jgi:SET domain-containing protein
MLRIRTILKPAGLKGIGLFSIDAIRVGRLIWAYDPNIDQVLARGAFQTRLQRAFREKYTTQQPDGTFQLCADNARFMNHSDNPNASSETDEWGRVVRMLATRNIGADEEITCDYRAQCEASRVSLEFQNIEDVAANSGGAGCPPLK